MLIKANLTESGCQHSHATRGAKAMWRCLILVIFSLVVGCAGTPDGVNASSTKTESGCPSWKIIVVEDDHYYCVDPDDLEREEW
jgi:hypothetical protein